MRETDCNARRQLMLTSLVVSDYDEAIAFYVGRLGFTLLEDKQLSASKRWVVVHPNGAGGDSGLLLARAADEAQRRAVGNQAGGRVFLFLRTDDFDRDYELYRSRGVQFTAPMRVEEYGKVAVFEDLYGNRWDLIEPTILPCDCSSRATASEPRFERNGVASC